MWILASEYLSSTISLRLIQIPSGVVNWSGKSVVIGLTHKAKSKSLEARIVSGSVILLAGSGLTTAINLAYNILVARYLGPKGFGQATVVYTFLTLLSGVTLSFQIVSTKVVAQQSSLEGKERPIEVSIEPPGVAGSSLRLCCCSFNNRLPIT